MKKIAFLLVSVMLLSLVSCQMQTPYIGENGNWWVGDKDLGVASQIQPETTEFKVGERTNKEYEVFSMYSEDADNILFDITYVIIAKEENVSMGDISGYENGRYKGKYIYEVTFSGATDKSLAGKRVDIYGIYSGDTVCYNTYTSPVIDENGYFETTFNVGCYETALTFIPKVLQLY